MSATLSNPSAIETVWVQLYRISRFHLYPSFADSSSHFLIDTYICGLRHLRYSFPHFEGRGDYLYSPIFRPITSGFTSSPPPFRATWKYVVTNRRALYFHACLPVRFLIRNSFSCFLIYAATMRDLWEFYLPRRETRNTGYICVYGWVGFGVYIPGAICDRPRENCGRELRWKWEVVKKKDSESRTKIREIRIRLVNHNSFGSCRWAIWSYGREEEWSKCLDSLLAKGILHSWNPALYVHTCTIIFDELERFLARVERLSISFRGFPLVTDSHEKSEKKIHHFSRRTRVTSFCFREMHTWFFLFLELSFVRLLQ